MHPIIAIGLAGLVLKPRRRPIVRHRHPGRWVRVGAKGHAKGPQDMPVPQENILDGVRHPADLPHRALSAAELKKLQGLVPSNMALAMARGAADYAADIGAPLEEQSAVFIDAYLKNGGALEDDISSANIEFGAGILTPEMLRWVKEKRKEFLQRASQYQKDLLKEDGSNS